MYTYTLWNINWPLKNKEILSIMNDNMDDNPDNKDEISQTDKEKKNYMNIHISEI